MKALYISRFLHVCRRTHLQKKRSSPYVETPLFSFLYSFDSGKHLRTPDLSEEAYPSDASYSMT